MTYLFAALGGLIALALAHFCGRVAGARNQRNEDRAKEADAHEKHLQDITEAASARGRVQPSDGMPDKYRRD